jgi:hypothetical protein
MKTVKVIRFKGKFLTVNNTYTANVEQAYHWSVNQQASDLCLMPGERLVKMTVRDRAQEDS